QEAPAQQSPDTTSRSGRPLPRLWVIRCQPRASHRIADWTRAHQFPSTGTTGQEPADGLPISITSPNAHPETGTPDDPPNATVTTTHTVTETPHNRYKPESCHRDAEAFVAGPAEVHSVLAFPGFLGDWGET